MIGEKRVWSEDRGMWVMNYLANDGPRRPWEKIKNCYPSSHSLRGLFKVHYIQSMFFQEIIEISPVLTRQLGCLAYISLAHL